MRESIAKSGSVEALFSEIRHEHLCLEHQEMMQQPFPAADFSRTAWARISATAASAAAALASAAAVFSSAAAAFSSAATALSSAATARRSAAIPAPLPSSTPGLSRKTHAGVGNPLI